MSKRKLPKATKKDIGVERNYLITKITARNPTGMQTDQMTPEGVEDLRAKWRAKHRFEMNQMSSETPACWPKEMDEAFAQMIKSEVFTDLIEGMDLILLREKKGDWSDAAQWNIEEDGEVLEIRFNRTWLGDIPLLEIDVSVGDHVCMAKEREA